jgi:hypothetical protein
LGILFAFSVMEVASFLPLSLAFVAFAYPMLNRAGLALGVGP